MAAAADRPGAPKPAWRAPAAIFAGAFAVRLALAWEAWQAVPFLRTPVVDGAEYFLRAREVAAGQVWPTVLHIHPPLYGWLIGAVFGTCGDAGFALFVLQAAIGAGTAVLLWRWTAHLADEPTARVAGVLAAVAWPLVFQEIHVSAAGPTVFLLAAAAVATIWAERGGPLRALLPGALVGLATLAHGMSLAFALVLGVPLLERTRSGATAALLALAAAAIPVLAVCAHHADLPGGSYALQSNVGMNVWIGNGATANGYPNVVQGPPYERLSHQAEDAGAVTAGESDALFLRQTVDRVRSHPLRWLGLVARKALATWSAAEVDSSIDAGLFSRELTLDLVAFGRWGCLAGLAIPGAILLWRRSPRRRVWLAVALAGWAPLLLLLTSNRYRAPLLLAIVPAAAVALRAAWVERERLQSRPGLLLAGAALAGAALSYADLPGVPTGSYFPTERMLGASYAMRADWKPAEAHTRAARAADPGDPMAALQLAKVLLCTGRSPEALQEVRAALALWPDFLEALDVAALILGTDRAEEVEPLYRAAADAAPTARLFAQWGRFEHARGRFADAADRLGRAVQLQPRNADTLARYGQALLDAGRPADAETQFGVLLESDPYDAAAHLGTARCRLARGDRAGAIHHAREASALGHPDAAAVLAEAERR